MDLTFRAPRPAGSKVIDFTPSLKRKQHEQERSWELTKQHLDWIVADVWPSSDEESPKVTIAHGKEPKRPPLPYRAEHVLDEIRTRIMFTKLELAELTEPALKGLAFAAREASEFENDLWAALAVECDRQREIKSRHRTGRGVWFAVIEASRSYPGKETEELLDEAFEKCQGKKAAIAAAQRLLKENAHKFNEYTSLEAKLYCDLEWEASEERRSGLSTSAY